MLSWGLVSIIISSIIWNLKSFKVGVEVGVGVGVELRVELGVGVGVGEENMNGKLKLVSFKKEENMNRKLRLVSFKEEDCFISIYFVITIQIYSIIINLIF